MRIVASYIDDCSTRGNGIYEDAQLDNLLANLEQVFTRFRLYNLKVKLAKLIIGYLIVQSMGRGISPHHPADDQQFQ